jgi:hypothetical protein
VNESGAYVLEEIDPAVAKDTLVRSGGKPYILVSLVDEESGAVELVSQGFTPDQIAAGLYEAAYQLEKQLIEQAIASGAVTYEDGFDGFEPNENLGDLTEALERAKQL